jgi:hypothetical protein
MWESHPEIFVTFPHPKNWSLSFQVWHRSVPRLLPTVSTVENLYIYEDPSSALTWSEDMESTRWLELLRPFIALKNLYLFKEFVPRIASALEDLEEGSITELLPSLQNIFVQRLQPSGHFQDGIRQFIAARRRIGHPITVSTW